MSCACAASSARAMPSRIVARLGDRHRAVREPRLEILAAQPLHHEVDAAVGKLAEREHVDDVRVADLVDRLRLVHEPIDLRLVRAQLGLQHLDRGRLADQRMDRVVHRAHRTFADLRLHLVLADRTAGDEVDQKARSRHAPLQRRSRRPSVRRGRVAFGCFEQLRLAITFVVESAWAYRWRFGRCGGNAAGRARARRPPLFRRIRHVLRRYYGAIGRANRGRAPRKRGPSA